MCRKLPLHTNLEEVKRDARDLLSALRRRDVSAVKRYQLSDPIAGMFVPRIDEAQYVIAREYGYPSWRKLKECLDTRKQFASQRKG